MALLGALQVLQPLAAADTLTTNW
eukprot:SAG22_NODE_19527_length_274_cov_0.588571_1_plen_23_part_10